MEENQRKQKKYQRKEKGKVKRKRGTSPRKVEKLNQEKTNQKLQGRIENFTLKLLGMNHA